MTTRDTPWILGIGCASHNGAACLLRGDQIVVAIQEERLIRVKRAQHAAGFASLATRYCLNYAGIEPSQLSCIGVATFRGESVKEDVNLNRELRPTANRVPVITLTHHLSHAVGVFATSGASEAAILIVDGNGSPWNYLSESELKCVIPVQKARYNADDSAVVEVLSMYYGDRTGVAPVEKHVAWRTRGRTGTGMMPFFSLGRLFENVGMQIFGDRLDGPGKVMGLAPFGKATIPPSAFYEILGDEICFKNDVQSLFQHDDRWPKRGIEYANLAASTQTALTEALEWVVRRVKTKTPADTLCYAGGVALNSVSNEHLISGGDFQDLFIMPAAEDSGTAIGAAYYALWHLGQPTTGRRLRRDSVGRTYCTSDIEKAIASQPAVSCRRLEDDALTKEVAHAISEGRIVGWFQEGSELGPRALGQRSIFADPRRTDMKDTLNRRVKFREPFRPFAPVILLDKTGDWLEVGRQSAESPFMLRVMKFHERVRPLVPAVVHVDGTGRIQTVRHDDNPTLYNLISEFERLTGLPILLNTSLNIAGEPIVETPDDALWCLLLSGIDICIIGCFIVTKHRDFSLLDWCPHLTAKWICQEQAISDGQINESLDVHSARMLFSGGSGYLDELEASTRTSSTTHIRIWVRSRWGDVVHATTADLLPVLRLMNGRMTGRDMLARLNAQGERYAESSFIRLLGDLARQGVIGIRRAVDA